MAGIKGLMSRVRRLEPRAGKVCRGIGSLERWEAECKAGIEEGRYSSDDMPDVMHCVRRWVEAGY